MSVEIAVMFVCMSSILLNNNNRLLKRFTILHGYGQRKMVDVSEIAD